MIEIKKGSLRNLKIKLFADGAELSEIAKAMENPLIQGFTTNPTLMRKAGVRDYKAFALDALERVKGLPISFEVFADDFPTMERQALEIASWGKNVYVKVPVTNTKGEFADDLIFDLSYSDVKLNVTALMTPDQVSQVSARISPNTPAIVSVFAGRIADTGRNPVPLMLECLAALQDKPNVELLWASPRELLNVFQADEIGCHIITATNDILKKLSTVGKNLLEYSLDTVKMFESDARAAGYHITTS
jgi:transaldolase